MKEINNNFHRTIHLIRAYWYLLMLILVAAFLRLYRIRDYVVFLGDEGRDALVWHHMVAQGEFTFIGPTASVGGFYLGPIYYYLALPFYWVWRDPVGPAIFVALVGIATVLLVYIAGRRWFGEIAGFSGAWLYAIAALVLRYSRASWNPNPLPFFSLFGVVFLWERSKRWTRLFSIGAGVSLGIAWQLHYLAVILAPVYVAIILVKNLTQEDERAVFRRLIAAAIEALYLFIGWIIGFFPFLAFEVYHHFPNTKTIFEFVTRPGGGVLDFQLLGLTRSFLRHTNELFFHIFLWPDGIASALTAVIATVVGSKVIVQTRQWGVLVWFLFGMTIFSLYQGNISNHYFGFLFPAPFLFIGAVAQHLWMKTTIGKPLVLLLLSLLTLDQINRWPISHEPNMMLEQTDRVASKIIEFSEGENFNFALITGGNSDHAYRYFLERKGRTSKTIEQEITRQLLVVCEKPEPDCQPLGNSLWEIAGFGRAEIVRREIVPPGLTVYKLTHYTGPL